MEPFVQILNGHWWKFWSCDTGRATRPDIALPLVEILVTCSDVTVILSAISNLK